jgi:hypothetical protein
MYDKIIKEYAQHFTILQYQPYETYSYSYFILNGTRIVYRVDILLSLFKNMKGERLWLKQQKSLPAK